MMRQNLGIKSYSGSGYSKYIGILSAWKILPNQTETETVLVTFSDSYFVEKLLERSTMLKLYEPSCNGKDYCVFLEKSSNKDKLMKQQKL